jgi:hypothetical protein
LEVSLRGQALAWALLALLSLAGGLGKRAPVCRLRWYSAIFFWPSLFSSLLAALRWPYHTAGGMVIWRLLLLAMALQLGYLVWARGGRFFSGNPPEDFGPQMSGLAKGVAQNFNLLIGHPFFVVSALVMLISFPKAAVSLLWALECLAVFLVSLVFRDRQFRFFTLAGLGACLVRLVFYDLARAETLTRAFVFIGVGLIMLLVNSLYNRFRFDD